MKKKLAIFDLDGTLFDTVPANFAAYQAALAPEGVRLEEEYFARACNGRYYRDFLPPLLGGEDEEQMEAVHRRKGALYPQFFSKIRPNEALFSLLEALRPTYYTALVTTAAPKSVMEILEYFGKRACFDLVLTQADVKEKKPHPEGFLLAMAHFSVPTENTVIFEDSPEGIAAARASGAAYFKVEHIL